MDRDKALDQLAKSFNIISRMNNLHDLTLKSDDRSSVRPGNTDLLNEFMRIICDYSPPDKKRVLEQAVNKTNLYSTTLKNFNHHVKATREYEYRNSADQITQALRILMPIMTNNSRVLADKLMRIYEILKT